MSIANEMEPNTSLPESDNQGGQEPSWAHDFSYSGLMARFTDEHVRAAIAKAVEQQRADDVAARRTAPEHAGALALRDLAAEQSLNPDQIPPANN
jgi:hypothetical protein